MRIRVQGNPGVEAGYSGSAAVVVELPVGIDVVDVVVVVAAKGNSLAV